MGDWRVLGAWISAALLGGVIGAFVESRAPGPFDADDAVACIERAAEQLGQPLQAPNVVEGEGTFEVTAAGRDGILRLVVRAADEHITDVALLRGGTADVLTRDDRLAILEAGC